jgi:hypothetical protein
VGPGIKASNPISLSTAHELVLNQQPTAYGEQNSTLDGAGHSRAKLYGERDAAGLGLGVADLAEIKQHGRRVPGVAANPPPGGGRRCSSPRRAEVTVATPSARARGERRCCSSPAGRTAPPLLLPHGRETRRPPLLIPHRADTSGLPPCSSKAARRRPTSALRLLQACTDQRCASPELHGRAVRERGRWEDEGHGLRN